MRRIDELNALEEAEAEKLSGIPITNLEEEDRAKVALLGALALMHKRRTDPKLKYTEYMSSVRTKDIASYLFGSDEEDAAAAAESVDDQGDQGLPDVVDPFRGEAETGGAGEERSDPADAESAVLSGDGVRA